MRHPRVTVALSQLLVVATLVLGSGAAAGAVAPPARSQMDPVTSAPSAAAAPTTVPSGSTVHTDPPITLAGGRTLSECINSNPKPGCSTSKSSDPHQLATLGVMFLGMVFIGWRITRGVRRKNRLRSA